MRRQFTVGPSRYLAILLIAMHSVASASLLPLALPSWAKAALACCALFSLGYHLWRDAWLAAPSACAGLALEGDQVTLLMRNGERVSGRILRDSLVTPYLTVLNVLPQGARLAHSAVILPDSMDADSFRQLRVLLKWGMGAAIAPPPRLI